MDYLKTDNINKKLGDFHLKNISFRIDKGKHYLLIGPCGSGKTTILEIIAGVKKPDTGKIILDDRDITQLPPQKRNIGFLYQEDSLFPHMSVADNISYGLKFKRLSEEEKRKKLYSVCDMLKLESIISRKNCKTLSGGQKKLVSFARAMIIEPELILLDEPTAFLDMEIKETVLSTIDKIKDAGISCIHVSHGWQEVMCITDKVLEINNGELVGKGHHVF